MDDKKEFKSVIDVKETKDSKQLKAEIKVNSREEIEIIIAYAQVAIYTLQHSGPEINSKAIREEIKMFYNKF